MLRQAAVWVWIIVFLQALWSVFSLMAVAHMNRQVAAAAEAAEAKVAAERENSRQVTWERDNAEERRQRLLLKGIVTPETRLPLSERRGEPMPKQVTAPVTADEGARLLACLWDTLHLVEEGAPQEDVRGRLRVTLGQPESEGP